MAAPMGKDADDSSTPNVTQFSGSFSSGIRTTNAETDRNPFANQFQRCTDFIDENIQTFRISISVTAAVGVLLIARSIRMYHIFRRVSDIPNEFITKNVKLYGRFVDVKEDPVHIIVEHTPILQLHRFRRKKLNTDDDTPKGLPVHLAGVELYKGSKGFLMERLTAHPSVRFQLLGVNQFNGLDCLVDLSKWKFPLARVSLNEDVLRCGLAKVAPLPGLHNQSWSTRLTQRLLAAEMRAEKKLRGVWMPEPKPKRIEALKAKLTWIRLPATVKKLTAFPRKAMEGLWGMLRWRKSGRDS